MTAEYDTTPAILQHKHYDEACVFEPGSLLRETKRQKAIAEGDVPCNSLDGAFSQFSVPVHRGTPWATDAPFRETAAAIEYAASRGLLAVEMQASSLYAFAEAG